MVIRKGRESKSHVEPQNSPMDSNVLGWKHTLRERSSTVRMSALQLCLNIYYTWHLQKYLLGSQTLEQQGLTSPCPFAQVL